MKAFISYSHHDARYLERLHIHLSQLRRQQLIQTWYDRELVVGDHIDEEINSNLGDSQLFIALVSPDFIASEYCYSKEMKAAFEMQDHGTMKIVAVVLEPCEWRATPLKDYLVLPTDGKEVSNFSNENTAFLQVTQGIRKLLEKADSSIIETPEDRSEDKPRSQKILQSGLRSKKKFDDIDRAEFRDRAFETINQYFREALSEVAGLDGLTTRFDHFEHTSFTASISNKNIGRVNHITVHSGGANSMGDIYFSYKERAEKNSSNGSFSIENDDYEQFFDSGMFGFSSFSNDNNTRLSSSEVAQRIFSEFMEKAGLNDG